MNRKKIMPYLLIVVVLLLFLAAEFLIPKPLNWTVSLSAEDKNPYGAYGLSMALEDLFPGQKVFVNHLSLYETDTFPGNPNYLVLAEQFMPDPQDTRILLEKVENGASAFIGATQFSGLFADTLGISAENLLFESIANNDYFEEHGDSLYVSFVGHEKAGEPFAYALAAVPAYFDSLPSPHQVLASNQHKKPVLVRIPWGKGQFFLSGTPLAFSNYYLLEGRNHQFIETALSEMAVAPLLWTDFYQSGRMESRTPLRFILSNPALRWGYYLGMGTLLLFILFGIKRRQRAIPTLNAPENTSLQFAASIGTLYFQQGDHLNLARKKMIYLNDHIRTHYRLTAAWHDVAFISQLARKSNKPEEEVQELAKHIQLTQTRQQISAQELLKLNKAINSFSKNPDQKFKSGIQDSGLNTQYSIHNTH